MTRFRCVPDRKRNEAAGAAPVNANPSQARRPPGVTMSSRRATSSSPPSREHPKSNIVDSTKDGAESVKPQNFPGGQSSVHGSLGQKPHRRFGRAEDVLGIASDLIEKAVDPLLSNRHPERFAITRDFAAVVCDRLPARRRGRIAENQISQEVDHPRHNNERGYEDRVAGHRVGFP